MDFDRQPRGLRHMDSQATLMSLLQLDPSPMEYEQDDPPTDGGFFDEKETTLEKVESGGSIGQVGLSGSGHGSIFYRTCAVRPPLQGSRS